MDLEPIKRLNRLWEPVYPYLARQIQELYGRAGGSIMEMGPFSGVIFALREINPSGSFAIAAFPREMGGTFRRQIEEKNISDLVVMETDPSLGGVGESSIDLAVFRGAFFFPSLFRVDFSAIHRVLRPRGRAFIGGGFGKYTPPAILDRIGRESRDLNLMIGKISVGEDEIRREIGESALSAEFEILTAGGLWAVMKK